MNDNSAYAASDSSAGKGMIKRKCAEYLQQCDTSSFISVSVDSRGDQLWVPSLHILHPPVYLHCKCIGVIINFDNYSFLWPVSMCDLQGLGNNKGC